MVVKPAPQLRQVGREWLYKAVSSVTGTVPAGSGIKAALQVGQVEVSSSVCPRVNTTEVLAPPSAAAEQMGTKEVAVCWNYSRVLLDNLPGGRRRRQRWRKTAASIMLPLAANDVARMTLPEEVCFLQQQLDNSFTSQSRLETPACSTVDASR
ncbi:uncharacterized protein V6R79_002196 [Siganus canaliculatus]